MRWITKSIRVFVTSNQWACRLTTSCSEASGREGCRGKLSHLCVSWAVCHWAPGPHSGTSAGRWDAAGSWWRVEAGTEEAWKSSEKRGGGKKVILAVWTKSSLDRRGDEAKKKQQNLHCCSSPILTVELCCNKLVKKHVLFFQNICTRGILLFGILFF